MSNRTFQLFPRSSLCTPDTELLIVLLKSAISLLNIGSCFAFFSSTISWSLTLNPPLWSFILFLLPFYFHLKDYFKISLPHAQNCHPSSGTAPTVCRQNLPSLIFTSLFFLFFNLKNSAVYISSIIILHSIMSHILPPTLFPVFLAACFQFISCLWLILNYSISYFLIHVRSRLHFIKQRWPQISLRAFSFSFYYQ